jgi:tight adherence protein B
VTPEDIFTACAFVCALLLGIMILVVQDMAKKRASARIATRMEIAFMAPGAREKKTVVTESQLFTLDNRDGPVHRWLQPKLARLKTVAGKNGLRIVIGAAVVGEIVARLMIHFMPLPDFVGPVLMFALPVYFLYRAYNYLVQRFRKRFLEGFPDVIDLIVRAVRAGVPVTHVIGTAAAECPEPLRQELQLMADSLSMGLDLEDVLAVAMRRIEIADFSFFCVCLLLQRETGGQLGETLENLSNIVRTRREIRQKSKALTGEARITTKIISSIPPITMLLLYLVNRSYVMVLFNHPTGQKLLSFGVVSVVIGVMVITKMAKMDTAR